jgi:hypothetical protein
MDWISVAQCLGLVGKPVSPQAVIVFNITAREKILAILIAISLVAWSYDRGRLAHHLRIMHRNGDFAVQRAKDVVARLEKTLEYAKRTGTIENQPALPGRARVPLSQPPQPVGTP